MNMNQLRNLKDLIDFSAETYGEKIAIRTKQKKEIIDKSYIALKADSEAFSRTLEKYALRGKHVALLGPTSYEWIVGYFGTVNSGGVVVPIDKELPAADICDELHRADVEVLVYDSSYADIAAQVRRDCPQVTSYFEMQREAHGEAVWSLRRCLEENCGAFDEPIDREKLSVIMYTSGTTGKSKGVMLNHRNLIDNVVHLEMGIEPGTAVLMTVLPIHHAYCFTCDILKGLQLGSTICINDSLMRIAKNLQVFKPNTMLVVPMIAQVMYNQVCEAAKKSLVIPKKVIAKAAFGGNLRTIYCGGAYLNPEMIEKFRELNINLVQGYGMTECAPCISRNSETCIKEDSVGKLLPGCEAKVVDGEIWVKSSSVMLGYYKNEEATRETLVDGWLRTGDLGYVDDEQFLYITGRKKNLIILSNGENVSPEELENRISEDPLVAEVLVYEEEGQITAEIYPNEDYVAKKRIQDIQKELSDRMDEMNRSLPMFKQVRRIKLRNTEFEKTTSRKIKRHYGSDRAE